MAYYFDNINGKQFKGRPRTTLPTILHSDIIRTIRQNLNITEYNINQLKKNREYLETLRLIASDRTKWGNLIKTIYDAANSREEYFVNNFQCEIALIYIYNQITATIIIIFNYLSIFNSYGILTVLCICTEKYKARARIVITLTEGFVFFPYR